MSHQNGGSARHKALTGAILAYARHIREPEVLAATIERIAQKHVALKIEPEHYEAVGTSLLAAISDVLGDAASDDVMLNRTRRHSELHSDQPFHVSTS